jgi:hypothetical protein
MIVDASSCVLRSLKLKKLLASGMFLGELPVVPNKRAVPQFLTRHPPSHTTSHPSILIFISQLPAVSISQISISQTMASPYKAICHTSDEVGRSLEVAMTGFRHEVEVSCSAIKSHPDPAGIKHASCCSLCFGCESLSLSSVSSFPLMFICYC